MDAVGKGTIHMRKAGLDWRYAIGLRPIWRRVEISGLGSNVDASEVWMSRDNVHEVGELS